MDCIITESELKKALKEIQRAKKNGFHYCEGVFRGYEFRGALIKLVYSDLLEKAHPTDGRYDWGRGQFVSKYHTFQNGKLINIEDE